MKTLTLSVLFTLSIPVFVNAAALCPKDSCNPANGCIDGCTTQELICNYNSVPLCAGKKIYSGCTRINNEQEFIGYCTPIPTSLPAACDCQ